MAVVHSLEEAEHLQGYEDCVSIGVSSSPSSTVLSGTRERWRRSWQGSRRRASSGAG